jgi:hypothetical protein
VKYRDFRYVVPFIVQLGLYVSSVGFSSNIIPEHRAQSDGRGHRRVSLVHSWWRESALLARFLAQSPDQIGKTLFHFPKLTDTQPQEKISDDVI